MARRLDGVEDEGEGDSNPQFFETNLRPFFGAFYTQFYPPPCIATLCNGEVTVIDLFERRALQLYSLPSLSALRSVNYF